MGRFRDRVDAGRRLAERLLAYAGRSDVLVLGLPRGGVPVAAEVARALGAPLDVFLVRKIGVPDHRELAMGAIAEGGVTVLDEPLIFDWHIPRPQVDQILAEERQELARRELQYSAGRRRREVTNRTVIVVDDGLATGATMEAAVKALRTLNPRAIVIAVPVGAAATCARLATAADALICVETPRDFIAVGRWYDDFSPTTDEDVRRLLA